MEIFDGNPLNYRYFMTLFREVVESKIEDPRGRLTRLIKYTTGEAKELIKPPWQHTEKKLENGHKSNLEMQQPSESSIIS